MDYPDISEDFSAEFEKAGAYHGHKCPSLFIAVTATLAALELARKMNIEPIRLEMEGKTDCFEDGVHSVFINKEKITKLPLKGGTSIMVTNGKIRIHVRILEELKEKIIGIKRAAGREHFLDKGIEYCYSLSPKEIYKYTIEK